MAIGSAGTQINDLWTEGQQQNIGNNNYWAVQNLLDVQAPNVNELMVQMQNLVQQGVLTPEQAQTFVQEASAYAGIDPRMQEAQMGSLGEMQRIVDTGGLDPQARANLQQAQTQTNEASRGQREALMQQSAARGTQGSGVETANAMLSNQGAATNLANQGFQTAADANNRKMQAIKGVSDIGGQVYGQEAQKAQAQNAINQFNTQNRQGVENMNVGSRNAAAAQNLAERQRISDTNTGLANQQSLYNSGMRQQDYSNRLSRAQSLSNANLGSAQSNLGVMAQKSAPVTADAAKWSDEKLKKDVKKFDAEKFMDQVTGYKYKYKNADKHGNGDKGEHVGIMAADMKKAHPKAVQVHKEGMKIDYAKLAGPAMASIGSLHKRLKKLEESDRG